MLPRIAVQLPAPLPVPSGFDVTQPSTWPEVTGRLEFVGGRLEYMPLCGEIQQRTAADVVTELNLWRRQHPEFVVGGNEAGMLLGGEVRAADAAVWRAGRAEQGFARVPPMLAVEVAGTDDTMEMLRDKARWYVEHGVATVWILDPRARSATVVTRRDEATHDGAAKLPEPEGLPGLTPLVGDFFRQLAEV